MITDTDGSVALVRFDVWNCDYSEPSTHARYPDLNDARNAAKAHGSTYGQRAVVHIIKDDHLGRRWFGAETYSKTPRFCYSS